LLFADKDMQKSTKRCCAAKTRSAALIAHSAAAQQQRTLTQQRRGEYAVTPRGAMHLMMYQRQQSVCFEYAECPLPPPPVYRRFHASRLFTPPNTTPSTIHRQHRAAHAVRRCPAAEKKTMQKECTCKKMSVFARDLHGFGDSATIPPADVA
jgi:hypothetical protein